MPKLIWTGLLAALLLFACSEAPSVADATPEPVATPAAVAAEPYTGDLDELRARGVVRLAHRRWANFDSLPVEGLSVEQYEALAEDFVASLGLAVQWVEVDGFVELLDAPLSGVADLAIGNISVTPERAAELAFSVPISRSAEWLVGRADGQRLGIPAGTAYVATAVEQNLGDYELLPDMTPEEVLAAIRDGQIDRSIMDAVEVRGTLPEGDIELLEEFPARPLAWAMRPEATALQAALDDFLRRKHLRAELQAEALRDLSAIQEAGRLRMITVSGPHTYFLYKGELMGFDYELMRRFAEQQDVALEVVVAGDRDQALELLQRGRGDVIAAAVTATKAREAAGWFFSKPYKSVQEWLISNRPMPPGENLVQRLADVPVHVNPSSSHWQTATELGIEPVAADATTSELLDSVAAGDISATIVDSHLLQFYNAVGRTVMAREIIKDDSGLSWGIRQDQPQLLAQLNDFVQRDYRSLEYNLLLKKYFGNARRVAKREAQRLMDNRLSPFDELLKPLGETHDFDWRLLVAQVYQESGFRPGRESFAGAKGLMQIMPRTARELGVAVADLDDPAVGLDAGVRYLSWCRERFEASLPLAERTWFALAAYNAGPGHVRDARKLARRLGLEPDLWFGNVETAMLKLAEPEYAKQATYGYVRGSEPVNYVKEIRERYQAYLDHLDHL